MSTTVLGIIVLGAAVPLLLWAIGGRRPTVVDGVPVMDGHEAELAKPAMDRVIVPAFSRFGDMIVKISPPGRVAALRRKIELAGLQGQWNLPRAYAYKAFFTALGVGCAFLVFIILGGGFWNLLIAAIVAFMGFIGMDYFLAKKATARQTAIEQSLPDILDQMTVCVEAGLGFDAALNRCTRSNHGPLADELGRTLQDIRLGAARSHALHGLLERTEVPDLRLFVRALIQAEKSGIPIAQVLRVQAEEAREKRRQKAEERAMKLPVLIIVPLVLCILPSLFLVIMGPAIKSMMDNGAL